MKKIFVLAVITFVLYSCDNSLCGTRKQMVEKYKRETTRIMHKQKNWHVPHKAPTKYSNAKVAALRDDAKDISPITNINQWIHSYAISNGLLFPQYFIMGINELVQFLNNNSTGAATPYLHFYLSIHSNTGSLDLVGAGASENPNSNTFSVTDIIPFPNQVFGNFYSPITCSIIPDKYIEGDGNYHYVAYPGPNIKNVAITPCLIPTQIAINKIDTYQTEVNQFPLALSFIIDTTYLRSFLASTGNQYNFAHGWNATAFPAQYIQIYLAYENNNPDLSTIILVGLDSEGNHVYYTPNQGQSLYIFNTAIPCPYCNVNPSVLPVSVQQ